MNWIEPEKIKGVWIGGGGKIETQNFKRQQKKKPHKWLMTKTLNKLEFQHI